MVLQRPPRRALAGAMISGAAVLAASTALAQVSYPDAVDRETLSAWLRQATDLSPDQVVGVSPSAVTAVVSRSQSAAGGPVELLLRAEALKPEAARAGLTAWEMRLEVDCRTGEVRVGGTTGFASRRRGAGEEPVSVAPAEPVWRKPSPGTSLEAAWRQACDPGFRPPLAAPTLHAATAPTARAPGPATPPPLALRPTLKSPAAKPPVAKPPAQAAAQASAPPPPPTPARRGHGSVQVVSSPVEADTRRGLERLHSRFPEQLAGLDTRVEPAQVRGRTVYRGLVAGFASHAEAATFCRTLKSRGHDCVAR
jgi:hypothetical protein